MTTTKTKTTTRKKSAPRTTVKAKTPEKLPPNPFVHEILEVVDKQRSKAKKVEVLKEYRNDALTAVLIWNYDTSVITVLPPGEVPYKENEVPVGTDHTSLRREWRHLYNFVKGGNDSLTALRRETCLLYTSPSPRD